jgi:hypothetical protein
MVELRTIDRIVLHYRGGQTFILAYRLGNDGFIIFVIICSFLYHISAALLFGYNFAAGILRGIRPCYASACVPRRAI